jgi:hypothetical protein
MTDTWPIENTEHAIAMEQSRSTAISLNNQVCELQKSIEQGNRANAKAQAIEIDRLRSENARLREALQAIMDCSKKSGIPGTTSAWYEFGEATANIARAALANAAG